MEPQQKYDHIDVAHYPSEIRENIDIFFADLDRFSRSSEMIETYLGRDASWGGMVTVPWNVLVKMVHCLLQPTIDNAKVEANNQSLF